MSAPQASKEITSLQPDPPSDVDLVMDFLIIHLQPKKGSAVAWEVLYENYSDWWADGPENVKPLSVAEFGAALAIVCKTAPIRVRKRGRQVFCCDVRLSDIPRLARAVRAQKLLPAPAADMLTP